MMLCFTLAIYHGFRSDMGRTDNSINRQFYRGCGLAYELASDHSRTRRSALAIVKCKGWSRYSTILRASGLPFLGPPAHKLFR